MLEYTAIHYFMYFIGTTFLSYLVCHCVLIWSKRFSLSNLQWKYVDYIWLLVTPISIYTLCISFDKYVSENVYQGELSRTKNSFTLFQNSFQFYADYYCYKPQKSNIVNPQFDEISDALNKLCLYFQEKKHTLPKLFEQPLSEVDSILDIPEKDKIFKFLSNDVINQLQNQLNFYKENRQIELELKKHLKFDSYYSNLFNIMILIGILLGLRLTKTTAEIRDLKQ